jgi:hypothetical protein
MLQTIPDSSQLPAIAFAMLSQTGETVAICRGECCCYRVGTTKTAEQLNEMYGVTKAQASAMLAGSLLGWHTPLADPGCYDAHGDLLYGGSGVTASSG